MVNDISSNNNVT